MGFLGGTVVKNLPANAEDARDMGSIPGLGRSPREGNGNPLQYFCLENSVDREAWQATAHRVAESDMTEQLSTHARHLAAGLRLYLEKEMATHSSILAWKIPRREKPGGLQSMGLQRVRHD